MQDHADSTLIGIAPVSYFVMHTLGELDSFPRLGENAQVFLYLIQPGPFKRRWLQHTFEDRQTKGVKITETLYRVVICGLHPEIIDNVCARCAKLNATLFIQNGTHLRPIEKQIKDSASKHSVPVVLLAKPINGASRSCLSE